MRIVGNSPFEDVVIENPDALVVVRGDYRLELGRLQGATVRASGMQRGNRLTVTTYEMLEIAGQLPIVGILELQQTSTFIRRADGRRVPFSGAPDELRDQAGAKVWITLDSAGVLTGYGVIRERR